MRHERILPDFAGFLDDARADMPNARWRVRA
jgi:hypothetical protein